MNTFLTTFLFMFLSLAFVITLIGELACRNTQGDIDSQYFDADGDHIYYERSLIEKKHFRQRNPNKSIRKFSSLFSWRKSFSY